MLPHQKIIVTLWPQIIHSFNRFFMIDIKPCFDETMRNIRTWRNRYLTAEYPHKVVINMMYRAYAMQHIWREYNNGSLPHFNSINDGIIWMEKHYSEVAMTKIQPNLLNWLQQSPNTSVGTLTFANYERLANLAESNTAKKEELEFSYIFELLEDKCVLFYIAIRQTGKSMTDTIAMMTNYMIEPINNLNYEMAKQVFQQLYIGKYMHENYTPIP